MVMTRMCRKQVYLFIVDGMNGSDMVEGCHFIWREQKCCDAAETKSMAVVCSVKA